MKRQTASTFASSKSISEVAYSTDGGQTWRDAVLGVDMGRYSFRDFRFGFASEAGPHDLRVRAFNPGGQSHATEATWNPAGYMRNVVESVIVTAV